MKLRMYLRGLGIGMAVSAVVLSVAMPKQKVMSDAEIIEKAKELGMVEEGSTLVSVATPKNENKSEEPEVEEPEAEEPKNEEPKPEKAEVKEPEVEETEVKELKAEEPKLEKAEVKEPEVKQEEKAEEPKVEEPKEEEPKEESKADNSKSAEKQEKKAEKEQPTVNKKSVTTITIAGGSSSDVVARLLEKGGVIDSASKFDSYLCSHNLDHVICAGTHEIPAGADYETISKIITSR